MKSWTEICISTKVVLADVVAEHLMLNLAACKDGVEISDNTVLFWVHTELAKDTISSVSLALSELNDMGLDVDPNAISSKESMQEVEWRDAWKKFFKTTKLTRQITVVPSWETITPEIDEHVIHLDPGMAFGTGAHASTQLVLQFMQELADTHANPRIALDVGTGSGILAIAACKYWPDLTCKATDIDPHSVSTTLENSEKNQTTDRIDVSLSPLGSLGTFDLVLANIQAPILKDLAPELKKRMNPGAHLILSGILTHQIEDVVGVYQALNCKTLSIAQSTLDSEWSAALITHPT